MDRTGNLRTGELGLVNQIATFAKGDVGSYQSCHGGVGKLVDAEFPEVITYRGERILSLVMACDELNKWRHKEDSDPLERDWALARDTGAVASGSLWEEDENIVLSFGGLGDHKLNLDIQMSPIMELCMLVRAPGESIMFTSFLLLPATPQKKTTNWVHDSSRFIIERRPQACREKFDYFRLMNARHNSLVTGEEKYRDEEMTLSLKKFVSRQRDCEWGIILRIKKLIESLPYAIQEFIGITDYPNPDCKMTENQYWSRKNQCKPREETPYDDGYPGFY